MLTQGGWHHIVVHIGGLPEAVCPGLLMSLPERRALHCV
jgi:hypothetical protein